MAGIRGKSGPPDNQNAFRHGLAALRNRRTEGTLTENFTEWRNPEIFTRQSIYRRYTIADESMLKDAA